MGRHSAPEPERPRNSLTDTTLTTLRKIMHLEPREEKDRVPRMDDGRTSASGESKPPFGVFDDDETEVWLHSLTEDIPPNVSGAGYQNWEYRMYKNEVVVCGGIYGITPTADDRADDVASSILSDFLGWNAISSDSARNWVCEVRRPGSLHWIGIAEGRP